MTAEEIARLCSREFPDLIRDVSVADARRNRVRLSLVDGSFIDIHQNPDGRIPTIGNDTKGPLDSSVSQITEGL